MGQNRLVRISDKVSKVCAQVSSVTGAVLIFAMTMIITMDVVGRQLGQPSYIGTEVSGYMLVGLVFLGMAHTQRLGRHIQITAVTDYLPKKYCRALDTINLVFAILVVAWLTWATGDATLDNFDLKTKSMSLLQFPLWVAWIQIPIGFGMFTLALIADLIKMVFVGEAQHAAPTDPASSW